MKHKLLSDFLEVSINFFGAEIESVKNKNGLEFMWQGRKEVWPRHAPVLFPVVGKLKDNSFVYNSTSYSLGQHGFARDLGFKLIATNSSSCVFELSSDAKTKEKYPFDFVFQIKYELVNSTLTTQYKIINPGQKTLFFSVGAHPGFNCPLLQSEQFEDYSLEFESSTYRVTELNNGLRKESKKELTLPNHKLYLTQELFDNDALVFENYQIGKISLCSEKSAHKITLECANWPYFGIWSKKRSGAFVCLEPWHGVADLETTDKDFTQKEGILKLKGQKQFACSFSLTFA